MPIIDVQRRIAEIGRIRIGQQVPAGAGKTRPAKLDTFRLTSSDRRRIADAAKLYGGTPAEWQAPAGRQWELVTETDHLNVIVPPADMAFTQWYELWSGGGCQRRCDGHNETISDGPCLCDPENRECTIHTRLSVLLKDVRGLGVWRIDTQGYYAAVELKGAVEIVRLAASRGEMLPAVLRLDQRAVKRGGQTRRFAVPVLDIDVSPAQLLAGRPPAAPLTLPEALPPPGPPLTLPEALPPPDDDALELARPSLTPVPDDVPEWPQTSVADQALAQPRRRRKTAHPIPKTGLKPRTTDDMADALAAVAAVKAVMPEARLMEPPPDEPPWPDEPPLPPPDDNQLGFPEPISAKQLKLMMIRFRERGFGDDDRAARLDYTISVIGRRIESAKELTFDEATQVLDTLES